MPRNDLEWLFATASKCELVVEIGVWKGRSTMALCEGGAKEVIAIDHFLGEPAKAESRAMAETQDLYGIARENLVEYIDSGQLLIVRMDSLSAGVALRTMGYTAKIDFIFIDGGHDYESVSQDIATFRPLLKPTGTLAGHDRTSEWGVAQAIAEAFPKDIEAVGGDIWRAVL